MSTTANQSTIANPAPLGLFGFGITTCLLNLHNAGLISLSIMIVAAGFAMGGLAQIIAGIMEFKKGNTFGATAFTSYGLFWWSLILIWINPFADIGVVDSIGMGFYFLLWCVFTAFMFIGTLKQNRASQVVFGSLTILYLLLALANFTGINALHIITGYEGIFCGLSAIYSALGQVLNQEYGKSVLPL